MTEGTNEQTTETTDQATHWVNSDDLVIRKLMPGILLVLTCHIRGGKKTKRENLQVEYVEVQNADGTTSRRKRTTWDGSEECLDEDEHHAADALRADVRRKIEGLGVKTPVGLIIPMKSQQLLANTLKNCRKRVAEFNAESKTCDVVYRYCPYESESSNKAAIAALNEQLDGILDHINEATRADDAHILEFASANDLIDPANRERVLTAQQILEGDPARRRQVIAKVRAKLARKAIKEAKTFSELLPEETGRAVDNLVAEMRKKATAWVAASKKGDEEYEAALNAVDTDGISDMQAALIMAAANADNEVEAATEAVADSEGQLSFVLGSGGDTDAVIEEEGAEPSPFLGAFVSGGDDTATE
jgi:hypothetical protein